MQIITLILSGLALLAACISVFMNIYEKRRSKERNAAMLKYIDSSIGNLERCVDGRIKKLEQGITPDYEQAKAAANAVNDFNRGITNILGFDPVSALKKEQQRERLGGDTE